MNRILIVDDDADNREVLKTRLESIGYQVTEAADGQEALQSVSQEAPDLIFLDVMMPKLDGCQVCRTLKANPKTQSIPVVMLTALNKQIEEMRGYESGADDYLTKPCDPGQLKQTAAKWLAPAAPQAAEGH